MIEVITTGLANHLADHCDNVTLEPREFKQVFVENPLTQVEALQVMNSSVGVQNYLVNEDLREEVRRTYLRASSDPATSTLYAFYNGKQFSDWLEVSFSRAFMTHEVGPQISYITGAAIPLTTNPKEAILGFGGVEETVDKLHYRGEVLVSITKDFRIANLDFGHFFGHFASYAELSKTSPRDILSFCFGENPVCELHNKASRAICVTNLISKPGFPSAPMAADPHIRAPSDAEKHLWRIQLGMHKPILVATSGNCLGEARNRTHRTIQNCRRYENSLQYRTDYGFRRGFVLETDQYEKLKERPKISSNRKSS